MKDIKTDTTDANRVDPLKMVVAYDLLRMAADMHRLKQNREYWESTAVPTRPNGRLTHESLRQAGVFAAPVAAYLVAAQFFGYGHALFGLPLYYGVFHLLERALTKTILKKREEEQDLDRGRYAFTKILGERLGLKPEEVTLEVVEKMVCDYGLHTIYGRNMPTEKKDAIMRRAYEIKDLKARLDYILLCFEQTKEFAPAVPKTDSRKGGKGGSGAGRSTSAAAAGSNSQADDDYYEGQKAYSQVNPTTGLPMANSAVDVGGNTYGQGNFGEL